jgi:glycosyltransferase involved in cell wall biosynthesis
MNDLPSVSVVIPVLNGAETIGDTLAGLMNQAQPPRETEIIVVDNGSTDGTRAAAQKFPLTLLTQPKRGPSAARNCGLYAARGEVIAYLDADTLPTRLWLREIVSPFVDANVLLVAGRILGYHPETMAERYYSYYHLDKAREHAQADGFPFASSGNMAVRRSAALCIGGWDEDFLVAQDVDFSHRLSKKFQTSIYYQPRALVFLRNHRTLPELKRQAFKYGQGRAKVWARNPHEAQWGLPRAMRIMGGLALIGVWPLVARLARQVGRANDEDVQLAEYHRAWNWWSWRGFASMMRHQEWR